MDFGDGEKLFHPALPGALRLFVPDGYEVGRRGLGELVEFGDAAYGDAGRLIKEAHEEVP
jgi:hypothetical protein